MSQEDLTETKRVAYITLFYVDHEWTSPSGDLKRWRAIASYGEALIWVRTYNPQFAQPGTYKVVFYKDSSMRLCIRKPPQETE